ncbi:MAG TPA: DUF4335 domain-containing protein [Leptolyngbyaceae cyanobacterium M65_K2018_010]|nr:DUF4335 domain-containing protein [Leptolyngbyaceae cyanobacterium M65_K2018_010]
MATLAPLTSYQYEAGSCTLRLRGHLSPLSHLADRPVLKQARFQLQLWAAEDLARATSAPQSPLLELAGRDSLLTELGLVVQGYVQTYLQGETLTPSQTVQRGGISLAPVGLTRHRLTLTVPGDHSPTQVVELSTLQLADLAAVLEQTDRALERLPEERLPTARSAARPRLTLWLGSVAAVLVAAVLGSQWLTPGPGPMLRSPTSTPATAPEAEPKAQGPPPQPSMASEPSPPGRPLSEDDSARSQAQPEITAEGPLRPGTTPSLSSSPAISGGGRTAVSPGATPSPVQPQESRPIREPAAPPSPPTIPAAPVPPPTIATAPTPSPSVSARSSGAESPTLAVPATEPATPESLAGSGARASSPLADTTDSPTADWVTQLTSALEQGWHPPSGLTAPLRYTLALDPQGEVTALIPLTELSRAYQTFPGLPQVGQTVYPLALGRAVTVEVQFLPSGAVHIRPMDPLPPPPGPPTREPR